MKILITGGSGLIGRTFITAAADKYQISVLTRSVQKTAALFPDNVFCTDRLTDIDFNQLDIIINLAGEPIAEKRWSDSQKEKICQSRWQLTEQISQRIKQAKTPPHTFISGSAIGYYGRQDTQYIDESYSNSYPEFTHQVCSRWENLATEAASEKTRVCLLRTGVVLAVDGGALKKMVPAFRSGLGGPIGNGEQYISWVHIQDMVRIITFLITHPTLEGVFNAVSPFPVTNKTFSQLLAKRLNRPACLPMPATVLKLMFGEMSEMLLYGQRVIPKRLLDAGFTFEYTELEKALANLPL